MKTSCPSHLRFRSLFATILVALVALPFARAATLVPNPWYSSHSPGVSEHGGVRFVTNEGNGVRHVLTYFKPASLTLVGDSLSVSFTFSVQFDADPGSNSSNFGFALYNSDGRRISADGHGAGTSNMTAFTDYRGYRVNMRTKPANASQAPLVLRTRAVSHNALGNTNAAHPILVEKVQGSGSAGSNLVSGYPYNVLYTITRVSDDALDISFTVRGRGLANYGYTWLVDATTIGFTTTFDTFAITLANEKIFDSITLTDVSITSGAFLPESSVAAR